MGYVGHPITDFFFLLLDLCLHEMNSTQLHRHLRSRPHHYHVIESNVKEEKKYLKSEDEIIEAIKDYRSSSLLIFVLEMIQFSLVNM